MDLAFSINTDINQTDPETRQFITDGLAEISQQAHTRLPVVAPVAISDDTSYLLARADGKVRGFIAFHWDGVVTHSYPYFTIPGMPFYLIIAAVYVDDSCRRQGIAQAMFYQLRTLAKAKMYRGMVLSVSAANATAQRCYYKFGFDTLETQWFGTPKSAGAKHVEPTILAPEVAVTDRVFKKLIDAQLRADGARWPILSFYRDRVKKNILSKIQELRTPVVLFNGGRYGAAALAETIEQKVLSGFPLILTAEARRYHARVAGCFNLIHHLGRKCFHTNSVCYSTFRSDDLSYTGLFKTYLVMVHHF